jgi:aryl-alcohol dehydrogenase-like predicted oxidoreductase
VSHPIIEALDRVNREQKIRARAVAEKEWAELEAFLRLKGVPPDVIAAHWKTFEMGVSIGFAHGIAAVLTAVEIGTTV